MFEGLTGKRIDTGGARADIRGVRGLLRGLILGGGKRGEV